MRTMTLNLSGEEMEVLENLALEQETSKTAVMRQALRLYQLLVVRAKAGETFHFSGDRERAIMFIGPGFPFSTDLHTQKEE